MAKSKPKANPSLDELVLRLAKNPLFLPNLTYLSGMARKSSKSGWCRLYVKPDLMEWIEFREADVVHREVISMGANELEWTIAWLNDGSEILRESIEPIQAQANFLRGEMQDHQVFNAVAFLAALGQVAQRWTKYSCYQHCATGKTICDIILCTLPGFGCAASRRPDVCV